MAINVNLQYNSGFLPDNTLLTHPGSSEVPRNPLTRWDVSSIPANGIFLTVVVVVVFTLKTVLTSIQYPSLSYSSRQRNEFPWSQANPK